VNKMYRFKKLTNRLLKFFGIHRSIATPKQRRSRRVCAKCETAIRKHHKWQFNEQGRAEHRNCDNPTVKIGGDPAVTVKQELVEVEPQ
jgi:hypothetical protein